MITDEQRDDVISSLEVGCLIEVAAKAARTTAAACRDLAANDETWRARLAAAETKGALARAQVEVTPAPPGEVAPPWADLAAMSAAQEREMEAPAKAVRTVEVIHPTTGEVTERAVAVDDDDSPDLERLRLAAAKYGPGQFGFLQLVNARCEAARLHPMDPWWVGHFRKFYASGKMIDLGRVGLRGGKSTNICRALVADVLYTRRQLEPSQIGVCPIMSAGTKEASDRIDTIMEVLRACGLTDVSGGRSPAARGEFRKIKGEGGAEVVELFDSQGHPVEFRVYPASKHGAVGFTAIAGFCDEVDLWRDKATGANPASAILDLLLFRFTTQPDAHLYIFSATYGSAESAHETLMSEGDTPLQYVARLGARGAQRDAEERWHLVARVGPEPRLLAAADPKSTNVPTWVTTPVVRIERCFDLSKGDLSKMFLYYGGHPNSGSGADNDTDFEVLGIEHRYGDEMRERSYGR